MFKKCINYIQSFVKYNSHFGINIVNSVIEGKNVKVGFIYFYMCIYIYRLQPTDLLANTAARYVDHAPATGTLPSTKIGGVFVV